MSGGRNERKANTDLYEYWCSFEVQTDWANILVKVSESYGNERNIVEPTINTG